jgi:hypothetical protein
MTKPLTFYDDGKNIDPVWINPLDLAKQTGVYRNRFSGILVRTFAVRNACRWSGVKPHARTIFVSRAVSGTGRRANFNASIRFTGCFSAIFLFNNSLR